MEEVQKTIISECFMSSVKKASEKMIRNGNNKEYLENPYNGFYVSTSTQKEDSDRKSIITGNFKRSIEKISA